MVSVEGVIASVQARDAFEHGVRAWAMVDLILDACPNQYLVRAVRDTIDSLAFQLSVTRTEETTVWADLEDGYPRLLAAIRDGDAVAAELAAETVFRL